MNLPLVSRHCVSATAGTEPATNASVETAIKSLRMSVSLDAAAALMRLQTQRRDEAAITLWQ
jgi:hypothetical protein